MEQNEPQLPPGAPIHVEKGADSTKIWYPANPGSRTPFGLILFTFLGIGIWGAVTILVFRGVFLSIFMGGDLGTSQSSLLVIPMMVLGIVLGWFVCYFMFIKTTIQYWLESQTVEVTQNNLKITKQSPFYREEKSYAFDDLQGIAFKHPQKGNVKQKFPTLMTDSGDKRFFEAATSPEGEWVVQYLQHLMKQ